MYQQHMRTSNWWHIKHIKEKNIFIRMARLAHNSVNEIFKRNKFMLFRAFWKWQNVGHSMKTCKIQCPILHENCYSSVRIFLQLMKTKKFLSVYWKKYATSGSWNVHKTNERLRAFERSTIFIFCHSFCMRNIFSKVKIFAEQVW